MIPKQHPNTAMQSSTLAAVQSGFPLFLNGTASEMIHVHAASTYTVAPRNCFEVILL